MSPKHLKLAFARTSVPSALTCRLTSPTASARVMVASKS